jgi:hypothetical protein
MTATDEPTKPPKCNRRIGIARGLFTVPDNIDEDKRGDQTSLRRRADLPAGAVNG